MNSAGINSTKKHLMYMTEAPKSAFLVHLLMHY